MSRPSKPARLWLRPARSDRSAHFVILDRGKESATGCGEADREAAEQQLARHLEANPPAPREPPVRVMPAPFVYVVSSQRAGWPVKIGSSVSPPGRLKGLQTGHHERLILLVQTPGTGADERALHRLFRRDRLEGEWFRRTAEIELFIELIGRRQLPLAAKWIADDRKHAATRSSAIRLPGSMPPPEFPQQQVDPTGRAPIPSE